LLDFIQTIRPKLIQEDDEEEFCDFEIYNIVYYDHPPLINSNGNTDHLEQSSLMENPKQRLFEELDRFDDSNAMPDISVSRKNIKIVNTSFSKNMDLEACSSEAANLDTSRILFTLESIKSSSGDDENTLNLCGGGEGMESLWEAYEEDTTNKISRSSKKKKNVKNNKSKSEFKYFDDGVSEDGDKDDQFMGNGQLCCFKALKMSTGKMIWAWGSHILILTTAARPFSIFDGSTATKAKKQDDCTKTIFFLLALAYKTMLKNYASMYNESARTKAQEQQDEPLFEG
ncbi:hypothetical protein Tco_0945647, partial [Tanacetum coccineum]